jgi:3-hydroxyacyl-CoA dehydrogenase
MTSQPQPIHRVGVVGAGFMGSGIAEASARAGTPVTLYEPAAQALDRSRDRIRASLDRAGRHAHASGCDPRLRAHSVAIRTDPLGAVGRCAGAAGRTGDMTHAAAAPTTGR